MRYHQRMDDVRAVVSADDYWEIASWWKARGQHVPPPNALPSTGRIVPGVCAGFLYKTDSTLAFLEGFITNPEASLRERSKAFDVVFAALVDAAAGMGVKHLVGLSGHPGVGRRVRKLGMRPAGRYSVYAKEVM